MPESVKFLPQRDVLTFEEITRFVSVVAQFGVSRIRLTGGEPLVRRDLAVLIAMLKSTDGISEVALTTNAVLLPSLATKLRDAGLDRLNISLDTVDAETFIKITRRDVLDQVLAGITAALKAGFQGIRINAVPIPVLSDAHLVDLAKFAKREGLELRFIEYMPLDGERNWSEKAVRSGDDLKQLLESSIARLEPVIREDVGQPAVDYQYVDDGVKVGFINSVTSPFCSTCNRMRLTAEGKLRNCLFSNAEWDVKQAIRFESDVSIETIVREAIAAKKAGHGTDDMSFLRPDRAMYQIGG